MQTRRLYRSLTGWLLKSLALLVPVCTGHTQDQPPTDDEITAILRTRIDTEKRGVGIVVGWIDQRGSRVISHGQTALAGGHDVNGQTIFEIGSVTKVFTATLLEQAVERGEMKLDDPVAKYLPPGVKIPARGNRQITLLDLATQRSGLPSMPDNFKPGNAANPYVDYTTEQMFAFLASYQLTRDIGSKYEYSNIGFGLLGQALAHQAGTDYESLVVKQVCQPLGLSDTRITLTPELRARLALPYDQVLAPTQNWDLPPAFAGAGALRSDGADLLKFLAANLGLTQSALTPALQATHQVRNDAGSPTMDIALAWHIAKKYGPPITWHNGGTGGYRSFVGFEPTRQWGVVVLSNTAIGVDDIGLHLLNRQYPLGVPPKVYTAITIKPEVGDQYVGRYQFAPDVFTTFTREGDRYFVQLTGQSKIEVFPSSETDFFLKVADAQISFVKDSQGHVTGLILHQNGDQTATRLP
jgi:D-alanyl-D-alanine-carboxypeptidase/D-alanyl-D-alanine-endopeptidase